MKYTVPKNGEQLRRLLLIPNPREETIFGIVGRMEVLLEYFVQNPDFHPLIPFLKTYYLVTKTSAEKYVTYKRYFWHMKDHEVLDIHFASLYFKPLLLYLEKRKLVTPWQQYFTYCQKDGGIPFVQMLLGINAHINTDLYKAILDLDYKNHRDFFLVNDILSEVIPHVMRYLAITEHDIFGLSAVVMHKFLQQEFHVVIERWRSEAWINAQLTKKSQKKKDYDIIALKTEAVGENIIREFEHIDLIHEIGKVISHMNSFSTLLFQQE